MESDLFSCTSASAEGQNGHIDFTPAAYRVPSQLPFRRSVFERFQMRVIELKLELERPIGATAPLA
jgi:hypothetical protein